ncbi:MAG: 4Fe-4S dicluster domain-containing protein [Deltaproteobacteria bacterium]|nr:4Fe-4S dicluster domain-containing protein [Deltaproteobacteria bacterium]
MEKNSLPSVLIDLKSCDLSFRHEVNERSGENVGLCWHCRTCAGGCPYVKAMDYHPHAVFRLVQLGLRKEALESSTIWICVSCNTCSIQCPAAIDIPAIMDALRHMALAEGVKIAQPEIVKFHEEVLGSIKRYGRTHKLEIMMRYKVRMRQWFQDMDLGLKMLARRKLDLTPSKIERPEEVSRLFTGSAKDGKH